MNDLLSRIETHIALKDSSPGFHLSDDDLLVIARALKAVAETNADVPLNASLLNCIPSDPKDFSNGK